MSSLQEEKKLRVLKRVEFGSRRRTDIRVKKWTPASKIVYATEDEEFCSDGSDTFKVNTKYIRNRCKHNVARGIRIFSAIIKNNK